MNAKSLTIILQKIVKELFDSLVEVEVTRPDEQFGDYATNVAMQLARELKKSPSDIALALKAELQQQPTIARVEVAGPGFINIWLTDQALAQSLAQNQETTLQGKQVLVEFGDANPFKAMHLGHLYTTIIGDAIANLYETVGAEVKRLSYHGDVGMHVAKAMWALLRYSGDDIEQLLTSEQKIGEFYAQGAAAFNEDPAAKSEIEELNRRIYELRLGNNDDERLSTLYDIGYKSSFKAFDSVFAELGVAYDRRYVESQSTKVGMQYVKQHTPDVFEQSDGAIIFRGEKVGLHTRVFINSRGLPTYEAKDLGLAELKNSDYPQADTSIIITANEQTEYFKVMLAALKQIDPTTAAKTRHISHGFLSLKSGKMSSRQGINENQVAANLLTAVRQAVAKQFPDVPAQVQKSVYLAAVKYTFLKNRIGGDIVFNVEESVALEGNSGPYLQYAHARARSILQKIGKQKDASLENLQPGERSLARKLSEYPEVLERATAELMPHYICTYLHELAQSFNRFYEHNRVVGDPRQAVRAMLLKKYAEVLRHGLNTLGIDAPQKL